jgi:uncharacterized repeat protein (TIGR01451 family)
MAESSYPIEVKAPKLQLQIVGPKLRHLERPAPYEAVIENSGTAVAKDLYITARLPRGMNFISASNEGTYLPDQHSVVWNLMELAAGTKAKTELVLLPVEEGRFAIAMTTDAEGVRADPTEREVLVEGQSELTFEIDDDNDPIEVAGMTTYSIRINNIGTRPDTEVRLAVEAPEGTTIEQVSSPMKYQVSGRQVIFAAIQATGGRQSGSQTRPRRNPGPKSIAPEPIARRAGHQGREHPGLSRPVVANHRVFAIFSLKLSATTPPFAKGFPREPPSGNLTLASSKINRTGPTSSFLNKILTSTSRKC